MISIDERSITRKKSITVEFFYKETKERFGLKLFNPGSDLTRLITEQNLHRPGLALAGFVELFAYKRIQIFGNTEKKYLSHLNKEKRKESLERIFNFKIPCVIITNNNKPSKLFLETAKKSNVPIFVTSHSTTKLAYLVSDFLEDQFSPRFSIHGSFIDVYGAGILLVGKSGIGKSEVALDLIERGHRLVADDVVIFTKKGENILMGSGTELVKHFMEIRGIGLVDVKSVFGIRAIRYQKRLEVVVELEEWSEKTNYTRTGLEKNVVNLLDIEIPYVKLPIIPGKNITVISEVIALNYLLKHYGYDAAVELQKKLNKTIQIKGKNKDRFVDYFEHDFE
ncbi:HPr kinase/phosphorylase [bacterium BMS3Abin04]|nr:HPr kinase/phosphorylase [bacterium BMS3Abin04]